MNSDSFELSRNFPSDLLAAEIAKDPQLCALMPCSHLLWPVHCEIQCLTFLFVLCRCLLWKITEINNSFWRLLLFFQFFGLTVHAIFVN